MVAPYKYRPPINNDTITFLAKKNDEDGLHIGKTTNNFVLYRNFILQYARVRAQLNRTEIYVLEEPAVANPDWALSYLGSQMLFQ